MKSIVKPFLFLPFLLLFSTGTLAQETSATEVHFRLDLTAVASTSKLNNVGIRGSMAPLSWESTFPLTDPDGDNIFEGKASFSVSDAAQSIEYKYVYGDVIWEMSDRGNRVLALDANLITLPLQTWNKNLPPFFEQLSKTSLSPSELQEDFKIFKESMMSLHPGLYRFQTKEEVDALFDAFESTLDSEMTYQEAFLSFSRFVPQLLCGHTLVNPYNQDDFIKSIIFETSDKLPFEFELIDRRMVVTRSATDAIQEGMEIKSINETPVAALVDTLIKYVSADGSNDSKRVYELQLSGIGEHELFDIYFPLLVPPASNGYSIEATPKGEQKPVTRLVSTVSRAERGKLMNATYGPGPASYDDLWSFELLDEKSGYLKIGTFVTYKMTMDWQGFLRDAFNTLKEKQTPNLIIDIRGNAGGMDIVGTTLLRSISTRPVTVPASETRIAYSRVPDSIRPYVSTWDDSIFDLSNKVKDTGNGYFVSKNETPRKQTYQPKADAYTGNVYILVDAANSSNTFFVARTAKSNQIATLVGEVTGGNLMGTNGGMMYFLRLPHSKVEVDIPIYGTFPTDEQPDRGVIPNIIANRTVEDAQQGVDTILEAALKEIRN